MSLKEIGCHRFFIVSKTRTSCLAWALFCYKNHFSKRATEVYILRECESVDDYNCEDEQIIGFCLRFIDKTRKTLIFACPSEESKEIWMIALREGITESQNCSADSGIASGGSLMIDPVANTYITGSTIRRSRYGFYDDIDPIPEDANVTTTSLPDCDEGELRKMSCVRKMSCKNGTSNKTETDTIFCNEKRIHNKKEAETAHIDADETSSSVSSSMLSVRSVMSSSDDTSNDGTQSTSHIGEDDTCVKTVDSHDESVTENDYANCVFLPRKTKQPT